MIGDPCRREGCDKTVTVRDQAYCSASCAPFAHLEDKRDDRPTFTLPLPLPVPPPILKRKRGRPIGSPNRTLSDAQNAPPRPFVPPGRASGLVTALFHALDQASKLYMEDSRNPRVTLVFENITRCCQELVKYNQEVTHRNDDIVNRAQ